MDDISIINNAIVANPWHGLIFVVATGALVFLIGLTTLLKTGEAERQSRLAIAFQEKFCFFEFQRRWVRKTQSPIILKIVVVIIMLGWLFGLYLSIRDVVKFHM